MMSSRAAQRYAKAVLSLAKEQDKTKEVNGEMLLVSQTLSTSEDLLRALKSPTVKLEAKRTTLLAVFKDTGAITKGLFNILIENKRIDIIEEVVNKYILLYNEMNGIQIATVTTAVPLSPEMEQKVLQKVRELTGGNASLKNKIDEAILGGFILRIGDLQYDASVSGSLTRLKREFKKTHTIQDYKSNGIAKNTTYTK